MVRRETLASQQKLGPLGIHIKKASTFLPPSSFPNGRGPIANIEGHSSDPPCTDAA